MPHDFITRESVLARGRDYSDVPTDKKWEAQRAMALSWGYNAQETEEHYPSSAQLLHELIEIVALGGNFLPNVGPTSTGEIPWVQARRLLEIGLWLRRHGGAIYGTRPWERPMGVCGDGLSVCYTASADAVHAILLGTPKEAHVELDVRVEPGAEVTIEGRAISLPWDSTDRGLRVELPEIPAEQPAFALQISPRSAIHPITERDG